MTTGRVASLLVAFLAMLGLAAGLMAPPRAEAAGARSFAHGLLAAHNAERQLYGLPPLAWSGKLAREAQDWARELSGGTALRHSTSEQRGGAGENLWAGTKRQYGPEEMIAAFLDERRHFTAGEFPKVSRTGKWKDVGHYTQIIWPETREVGCAIAPGEHWDFLVCRYHPAGNVYGRRVG